MRVADVKPERVEWLWQNRIPLGKVTVLDGDPGLGKSTLTLDLAARASRGSAMPVESAGREPAGVVLLTGEDGIADTIRPRLEAAGADLKRIVVLTAVRDAEGRPQAPMLPNHVTALREATRRVGARLVVVDPLMAFLSGRVDSHRDQDVRGALRELAEMAESAGAAVVIVRHLNKTQGGHPIYRGGGSIGIIGAARAALLVAPNPKDESRRVLAVSKANLGPIPLSLAWRLVPVGETCAVSWEGASDCSAKDLLRRSRRTGGRPAHGKRPRGSSASCSPTARLRRRTSVARPKRWASATPPSAGPRIDSASERRRPAGSSAGIPRGTGSCPPKA